MRLTEAERSTAIEYGQDMAAKLTGERGTRQVQVRHSFVLRDDVTDPAPSAASLQRHPGPDALALKLELSLLWVAGSEGGPSMVSDRPKFSTEVPASDYARLLGLRDPDKGGARRIRQALRTLREELFIAKEPRSAVVTLLREDRPGIDSAYSRPGVHGPGKSRYFSLPPTLWSRGWIAEFSGAELLCLLAIKALEGKTSIAGDLDPVAPSRDRREDVFILPSVRRSRLDVSEGTLHKGIRGLVALGVVSEHYRQRRRRWRTSEYSRVRYLRLNSDRFRAKPTRS